MTQYRVYLSEDENRSLVHAARHLNQRPQDTLRGLVGQLARHHQLMVLEPRLAHLETQFGAVWTLLEILAAEVGFVAGVTRLSIKNNDVLTRAGTAQEASLRRQTEALSGAFGGGRAAARTEEFEVS